MVEVAQDLGDAEDAHGQHRKVDAVGQERQPKVMRSSPVSRSVPTVESRTPTRIIATAFRIEPWASTTAKTRPMIIREKYPVGPNRRARPVSGLPRAAMTRVATVPAKNEPMAAMPSATPAWPWRAIW